MTVHQTKPDGYYTSVELAERFGVTPSIIAGCLRKAKRNLRLVSDEAPYQRPIYALDEAQELMEAWLGNSRLQGKSRRAKRYRIAAAKKQRLLARKN